MQPLYEADTVITFEVYEKFSKAIRRKPNPVLLYGLILVAAALVLDILFFTKGNTSLGGLGLAVTAAIPFILMFREKRARRRAWANNKALHDVRIHYAFYADHLEQSSAIGSSRYDYKLLSRVLETKDAFYLFTSAKQGLIVDKGGCGEELCAFIRGIRAD